MNIPGNKRVLLADLSTIDADVGVVLWVEGVGEYKAVPRDQAASNAVAGPADALTPISWQPSGALVTLSDGSTVVASGITRANKVVSGSGVQSLVPGATTVPAAADVAAGKALLRGSVFWGSSLAVTKASSGTVYTPAALDALTGIELGTSLAVGMDGRANTAILLLPTAVSAQHSLELTVTGVVAGQYTTIHGWIKPNAIVAGQSGGLMFYVTDANGFTRIFFEAASGARLSPGNSPGANTQLQSYRRNDGWVEFEFSYIAANTAVSMRPQPDSGTTTWTGDGTTGLLIEGLSITSVTATAVTNLSTIGTGTCAQVIANAPWIESGTLPENGWWPDGSDAFKFWGLSSKTLAFSAAVYEAISGAAQPLTLTWAWAPYMTPAADGRLWYFAGATAVLSVELTTANKLKLTRTTDAGATATLTFDTIVGHVPAIYSVVLDGTNALLYRQGALVESDAFSLAGAVTFTSGSIGGQIPARVADFAIDSTVLTATQIRQQHTVIGIARKVRLDPMPVWFRVSQSNGYKNAFGAGVTSAGPGLTVFGSTARNTEALEYLTAMTGDWADKDVGWGPSRYQHHIIRADYATPYKFDNGASRMGEQAYYGSEFGFQETIGRSALVFFGLGGTPITDFMPPSGAQYANMLAQFDAAIASIGLPYYLAGIIYAFGENDGGTIALADAFGDNMRSLANTLGARYGTAVPLILTHEQHIGAVSVIYRELVRARTRELAEGDETVGVINVDDQLLNWADLSHFTYGTTQYELGLRLGAKARELGA